VVSLDQVVASPAHVLGDNALLLKYLNPHVVVIASTALTPKKPNPPAEAAAPATNTNNAGKSLNSVREGFMPRVPPSL
jgi:hypothetical protein